MGTGLENRTQLDLRGRTITTYLAYELFDALEALTVGERVDIVTDVFGAIDTDLRAWCHATGNVLVGPESSGDTWQFTIEKGPARRSDRRFAAVVTDDGLFELLAPLGFALAAALEGHDVALYFQGPAVKVLASGFTAKMHGLWRPFSRFPRRGLERAGHVSPQVKLQQLQRLGARIYACGPSMEHYRVAPSDVVFGDVTVAEYLTFMAELDRAAIHLYS